MRNNVDRSNKYLIIFLVTFFTYNAHALCLPEGSDNESKDEFIASIAQSLVYIKAGHTTLISNLPTKQGQSLTVQIADLLVNMKTANKQMECAKEHVERFKLSKNNDIKISATGLFDAVNTLVKINTLQQEKVKESIDSKVDNASGEKAEEEANIRMESKEAWEKLGLAVALTTHLIPNEKDSKFCGISENTVKKSIALIDDNFSKKELSKATQWIDASASALRKVLTFKWKYKK